VNQRKCAASLRGRIDSDVGNEQKWVYWRGEQRRKALGGRYTRGARLYDQMNLMSNDLPGINVLRIKVDRNHFENDFQIDLAILFPL
jgi:hypothetical protein